ncbi:hypothetical protein D3C78_302010 [compost metagenome]
MSISSLTNSAESFLAYREKLEQYIASGYPKCDPAILPIVKKFNSLPGVSTTDCCESHPEFIANIWKTDDLYIASMVTSEGLDNLGLIFNWFFGNVLNDEHLSMLCSQLQLRVRLRMISSTYQKPGYVWAITVPIRHPDDKARVLAHLERAVDDVIRDRTG